MFETLLLHNRLFIAISMFLQKGDMRSDGKIPLLFIGIIKQYLAVFYVNMFHPHANHLHIDLYIVQEGNARFML